VSEVDVFSMVSRRGDWQEEGMEDERWRKGGGRRGRR
jgi:hypothetical protein